MAGHAPFLLAANASWAYVCHVVNKKPPGPLVLIIFAGLAALSLATLVFEALSLFASILFAIGAALFVCFVHAMGLPAEKTSALSPIHPPRAPPLT